MSPGATIELSIIILNYNTREPLRECLQSLLEEGSTSISPSRGSTDRLKTEVIVVDNRSSDGSAEMVAANFPWARLIRSPRNGGFASGNNQALRVARGNLVLLLNPDTYVSPGRIGCLVQALRDHRGAGVVGPKLLRADGSMHLACRRSFPTPSVALYRLLGLSRRFPHSRRFARYNLTYLDPDLPSEVDSVCGACMLVRREAIEQAGLLDEQFFMYGEDLDWCLRMKQRGWSVRYEPSVEIQHQHGAASRKRVLRTTFHFFHAMDLFYRKHYIRKYNPAISAIVLAGIYAGLVLALVRVAFTPAPRRRVGV